MMRNLFCISGKLVIAELVLSESGPAYVRRNEVPQLNGRRGKPADAKMRVEENRGDVGAVE